MPVTVAFLGMAALIYLTAPRRRVSRLLAALLFLEGLSLGWWGGFLSASAASPAAFFATMHVSWTGWMPAPFLYLAFLGAALDTPMVRRLRGRPVASAAVGAGSACAVVALLQPGWFIGPVLADEVSGVGHYYDAGALGGMLFVAFLGAVSLFGLAASVSAYRRTAPGTPARARARSFLLAFAVRDALFVSVGLVAMPVLLLAVAPEGTGAPPWTVPFLQAFLAATLLGLVAFALLLGHGILRTQLFDLDVKVKWTLKQSTVAAAFIGVFFVVSEGAQVVLSESVGPLLGIAAAGMLVFAIAPLQRAAERVASAAMPGVKAPEQLTGAERASLYLEQARIAWADGALSKDERAMLNGLRERLGLSGDEALRLETEASGGPS